MSCRRERNWKGRVKEIYRWERWIIVVVLGDVEGVLVAWVRILITIK